MQEARLEQLEAGLVPADDGWFVLNVVDAVWDDHDTFGSGAGTEHPERRFTGVGYHIHVLPPGCPNGMYHHESIQEDFLVLSGECVLLVEEQERRLKPWDFVHCPPGTHHIFVGAGDGPCVLLMVSNRDPAKRIEYPRSELALRYGAGVETPTSSPQEAYAGFPEPKVARPPYWNELPWARA